VVVSAGHRRVLSMRTADLRSCRPRISFVRLRNLVLTGLLALTLAASVSSAESRGAAAPRLTPYSRDGVTVLMPAEWRVLRRRLTPCVDPSERLTVAGHGALVMLQERIHPIADGFPARPLRFELKGAPEYMECCAPLTRRGWMLRFTDNRRGFYAYVYLGGRGTRAQVLEILQSLRVAPLRSQAPFARRGPGGERRRLF
jgi:hypothetical protein